MSVNFDCLSNEFKDRYDFQHCLGKIMEGYSTKTYVETDDICQFLNQIQELLYKTIDDLTLENDQIGASIVMDNVFEVILTIHRKVGDKVDLLEEFNVINSMLREFDSSLGPKSKLQLLQQIKDQCTIYKSRSIEELEAARKLRMDQTITKEDYKFLKE